MHLVQIMLLLETELQIKYDIAVVLRKRKSYGDYEAGLRKLLLYVELRVNNP